MQRIPFRNQTRKEYMNPFRRFVLFQLRISMSRPSDWKNMFILNWRRNWYAESNVIMMVGYLSEISKHIPKCVSREIWLSAFKPHPVQLTHTFKYLGRELKLVTFISLFIHTNQHDTSIGGRNLKVNLQELTLKNKFFRKHTIIREAS